MYRDPVTVKPVPYYCKLPSDISEREVIVLDPMLATGGSAIDAIDQIKTFHPKSIKFMGIIAAPEVLKLLRRLIPMLIFSALLLMRDLMSTATLFPVLVMPVTEYSAQSNLRLK